MFAGEVANIWVSGHRNQVNNMLISANNVEKCEISAIYMNNDTHLPTECLKTLKTKAEMMFI